MTELDRQTSCAGVGQVEDQGQVRLRELMITHGEKLYRITVATPDYISQLRGYNQNFPSEVQIDDNLYPFDDVSDVEEICSSLSMIPLETLQPYLTEQTQLPEASPH